MSVQQKKHPFDFKTQYGLGFSTQDDEIVVDFFCGGGGAGTGLEMGLGRAVNVAKNHSPQAISMHTVNHPGAVHYTTDVFDGDPDTECGGKAVGWFHMSPDYTHHSQAAGGQPRKREIRNLSWIGLKWAGKKKPRVISLENVKQTPDYLTKEFSKARDAAHAYDNVPAGERPTFHEIRALGAWLYEQQKFPQEYIQALMGHADEKMTKHYQEGHDEKKIEYLEVGAELAF
jgi:hypothetical protein